MDDYSISSITFTATAHDQGWSSYPADHGGPDKRAAISWEVSRTEALFAPDLARHVPRLIHVDGHLGAGHVACRGGWGAEVRLRPVAWSVS